jgi:uncharacterized protein
MPSTQKLLLTCLALLFMAGPPTMGCNNNGPAKVPLARTAVADTLPPAFPKRLGWVSDYQKLFTAQQVLLLDSAIARFEQETGNEIAIVTLHPPQATKANFDSLVVALGDAWGVGKKDRNNGVVMGLDTVLKRIRISTGKGVMDMLPDAEVKKIIDETILPQYKQQRYFEGTWLGLRAMMDKLR